MTFLHNHKDVIAAMDFFVIPTVGFRLLNIWFIIDHGRRRIVHFNEQHLQRLLRDYIAYYNADRVHTRLRDAPERRSVEVRPSLDARVVGSPRVGGLHHRYTWREAA